MNLFKRELGKNSKAVKIALIAVLQENTDKYIIDQRELNHLLQQWDGEEDISYKITEYTDKMVHLHTQSREVCNTYQLLFNRELDVDKALQVAIDAYYPLLNQSMRGPIVKTNGDFEGFSPKESSVDPIKDAIIAALCKSTGAKPEDIHISGGRINKKILESLDPNKFNGMEDFLNAARDQSEKLESGKSGEEIISDAVIKTAEDKAKSDTKKPGDSTRFKGPKTDA